MALRCPVSLRVSKFIKWCSALPFTEPRTKGYLSKEYTKQTKIDLSPCYFGSVKNEILAKTIKNAKYSLDVQAKLMCLFGLPIGQKLFNKLKKSAFVKLDEKRRIIKYKHGKTVYQCVHKTPKRNGWSNTKRISESESEGDDSEDGVSEESENDSELDDDVASSTSAPRSIKIKTRDNMKRAVQNESNNIASEPSQTDILSSNETASERITFTPEPSGPSYPEHRTSAVQESPTSSSMNLETSYTYKNTYIPPLEALLHKLEYFFLYKCRTDWMPLCRRIKEVKEKAMFSQKIVLESTIKSFFDVFLRLMVAELCQTMKMDEDIYEVPLQIHEFLKELKSQQLMNGIEEIIDSLIAETNKKQEVSFDVISKTFLEIVNNLAKLC